MIVAVDTETRGLDATKFLMGVLITEKNPKKPEIYRNKEELWNRIIQLGKTEARSGHCLNVYAHNHEYDYYAYANLTDEHIKWFCTKPFIISYNQKQTNGNTKEIIKFLDTMSIYKMSLAKMAKLWGLEKLEMPKKLLTGKEPTKKELKKIETYCINDTKIVLQTIINLKKKLATEGIKIKRLYTINQIAINYLINYLRKRSDCEDLFWDVKTGEFRKTWKPELIHPAYRGGRVQAIKTGKYENCTTIDINSLYPSEASKMTWPDLKNGYQVIKEPKKIPKEELVGTIRCMLKNVKNNLGLLPIRTPNGSYYPGTGKYLIGTWTINEVKLALKEGYELLKIEWILAYKPRKENPLKEYMNELYHKRKNNGSEHDNYFYKQMMNSCIGKMAQNRNETETIIDSVEKAEEYLARNYKIIKGIKLDYAYQRELPKNTKKYYHPLIPTIITANARITLYQSLKKVEQKDLLYCDTDSITLKNWKKYEKKFKISNEMGDWKIVQEGVNCEIIARKTYRMGDEIKISGMHKHENTTKEWEQGLVTDQKMKTIKNTKEIIETGKFETTTRDLKTQSINNERIQELLDECVIHVDEDLTDLATFLPTINKTMNKA